MTDNQPSSSVSCLRTRKYCMQKLVQDIDVASVFGLQHCMSVVAGDLKFYIGDLYDGFIDTAL